MANGAWSNDGVTTLVIPTGATTGRRIVIDGVSGEIDMYDSGNRLVSRIWSGGIVMSPDLDDPAQPEADLSPDGSLVLTPPDQPGFTYDGNLIIAGSGSSNNAGWLLITSPVEVSQIDSFDDEVRILMQSRSPSSAIASTLQIGTDTIEVLEQNNVVGHLDIKFNTVSTGYGVIGGQRWTNNVNFAVGIVGTELATNMSTGSVAVLNGRRYRIRFKIKTIGTAANDVYAFRVRENTVAGTQRGEFVWLNQSASFGWTQPVFESDYVATADASIDFILTAQRLTGAGSLTLSGGTANVVAYAEVEDVGIATGVTTH